MALEMPGEAKQPTHDERPPDESFRCIDQASSIQKANRPPGRQLAATAICLPSVESTRDRNRVNRLGDGWKRDCDRPQHWHLHTARRH